MSSGYAIPKIVMRGAYLSFMVAALVFVLMLTLTAMHP